jgi:mannose-6-phosphate isomerase-like protein (cupin superfamily)
MELQNQKINLNDCFNIEDKTNKLEILRDLTDQLPEFPHGAVPRIKYGSKDKYWVGLALWYEKDIAVQIAEAPAGVDLPIHVHENSSEMLMVYKGEIQVTINDEIFIVKPGETITFYPGQKHHVITLQPTSILAAIIPAIEEYPHGPKS